MKAYISGALATAKNLSSAKELYSAMAESCEQAGVHAYLPHKKTDPVLHAHVTDIEVAQTDLQALLNADCVVVSLSDPSLGVGAELAIALQHSKPVYAIWRSDVSVSRFLLGLLKSSRSFEYFVYEDSADACNWINERLSLS